MLARRKKSISGKQESRNLNETTDSILASAGFASVYADWLATGIVSDSEAVPNRAEWLGPALVDGRLRNRVRGRKLEMKFESIQTAWRGHEAFADVLVRAMRPKVVVDLGVDYGFSTIAFARPNIGMVFAVDHFIGDLQTGERNSLEQFQENLRDSGVTNVRTIMSDFDEAAKAWKETLQFGAVEQEGRIRAWPIDILHIDGEHSYASTRHNFETWSPFVRSGGVVLMHDVNSFPNDTGRAFNEIDWPKFKFEHAGGLGVLCRS